MNYFRKPDHSYHRVIFEFTDKEMENAGFVRLSLIPSELEILQLLQRIEDKELNKTNQSFELQRKKDLWKAKALRLIGFLNKKDKEKEWLLNNIVRKQWYLGCNYTHKELRKIAENDMQQALKD